MWVKGGGRNVSQPELGAWVSELTRVPDEAALVQHLWTLAPILGGHQAQYVEASGPGLHRVWSRGEGVQGVLEPSHGWPRRLLDALGSQAPALLELRELPELSSEPGGPAGPVGWPGGRPPGETGPLLVLPCPCDSPQRGALLVTLASGPLNPVLPLDRLASALSTAFERVRLSARVQALDERMRALDELPVGLFQTDADGRLTWVNRQFRALTGLASEDPQAPWERVLPDHEYGRFAAWWQGGRPEPGSPPYQFALARDGWTRWLALSVSALPASFRTAAPAGAAEVPRGTLHGGQIGTLSDVTGQRAAQDRLTFQAQHDPLTLLPNRAFLAQVWPPLLASAQASGQQVALLFIDLERFKQVNDSLGHLVGDRLLTLLARRMQQVVGQRGVVVRHGGDEFVVLLRDLDHTQEALDLAAHLQTAIEVPQRVGQHVVRVSCRIGLSFAPQDAQDLPTLLQYADSAMYRLKHARQGGVLAYRSGMEGGALAQLGLENDFHRALACQELRLHYQPQFDLRSGRQVAWEGLLRWQHPEHGLMHPAAFLPMVAEAGLLLRLGDWVIRQAYGQIWSWLQDGAAPMRVAVNVDARQLLPGQLPDLIGALQREFPIYDGNLELEVTEEALLPDLASAQQDLKWIKAAGITVAIDDFGRGFSNLGQLQWLQVDRLKIDRSYITQLEHSASDRAIVQAAISLGHALGARVLAEGVETDGQLAVLRDLGCDEGQGYLWGPPRLPEEVRRQRSG